MPVPFYRVENASKSVLCVLSLSQITRMANEATSGEQTSDGLTSVDALMAQAMTSQEPSDQHQSSNDDFLRQALDSAGILPDTDAPTSAGFDSVFEGEDPLAGKSQLNRGVRVLEYKNRS